MDAVHVQVLAGVRYWEDAKVNGVVEDNDNPKIPFRQGNRWVPRIRISDGVTEGWPGGVTADVYYKVCDDGVYCLLSAAREVLATLEGYVPDWLSPLEPGFGDYIVMSIGGDGRILGWKPPDFAELGWCAP